MRRLETILRYELLGRNKLTKLLGLWLIATVIALEVLLRNIDLLRILIRWIEWGRILSLVRHRRLLGLDLGLSSLKSAFSLK